MFKKYFCYHEPETFNENSTEGIRDYLDQIKSLEGTRKEAFEELVNEFEFSSQQAEYYLQVFWDRMLV